MGVRSAFHTAVENAAFHYRGSKNTGYLYDGKPHRIQALIISVAGFLLFFPALLYVEARSRYSNQTEKAGGDTL